MASNNAAPADQAARCSPVHQQNGTPHQGQVHPLHALRLPLLLLLLLLHLLLLLLFLFQGLLGLLVHQGWLWLLGIAGGGAAALHRSPHLAVPEGGTLLARLLAVAAAAGLACGHVPAVKDDGGCVSTVELWHAWSLRCAQQHNGVV
jgi:hypothetical protein